MAGLLDEGFEEATGKPAEKAEGKPEDKSANRPDFRVVQTDTDRDGRTMYKNVGGMWKNVSKNGNEFYTLLIGNLKLLVFPNTQKERK